ncbi:MAG UNVERIFIED_CONTAM: hypothetical protein LVT10_09025 [Anaerolineae bacterium]
MAQRFAPADGMTHLRLPIDRVFHLKGYGTVVTGTLHGEATRCRCGSFDRPQRTAGTDTPTSEP